MRLHTFVKKVFNIWPQTANNHCLLDCGAGVSLLFHSAGAKRSLDTHIKMQRQWPMCSLVGRRSRTSWWSRRSETTSDFLGSHPNRSRQNLQVKSFPRKSFLSAAALSLNCAYLLPPFLAPHCKALVAGCPMSKESQGLSFMQVREGKSSGERNEKDFSQGLFQKPKKALFWILLVSFVFVFVFVF